MVGPAEMLQPADGLGSMHATAITSKIDEFPDTLTVDDATWLPVYGSRDGKPTWAWPRDSRLPIGLHASPDLLPRLPAAGMESAFRMGMFPPSRIGYRACARST